MSLKEVRIKLIAINGYAGVGKDTVGKMIQCCLQSKCMGDYDFYCDQLYFHTIQFEYQLKSFAAVPVAMYKLLTGVDYYQIPREVKDQIRPDFIKFVQGLLKDEYGEDVWVKALFRERDEHSSLHKILKEPSWIITDMRFECELEEVLRRGGVTIRVERQIQTEEGTEYIKPFHESEKGLDSKSFDFTILNNGNKEALYYKVREMCIKIMKIEDPWK